MVRSMKKAVAVFLGPRSIDRMSFAFTRVNVPACLCIQTITGAAVGRKDTAIDRRVSPQDMFFAFGTSYRCYHNQGVMAPVRRKVVNLQQNLSLKRKFNPVIE